VWIFGSPDDKTRPLRSREGHSGGALTRIRYQGGTTNMFMGDYVDEMCCKLIFSGSEGSIRQFNKAIVESQDRETSKKKPILRRLGM
jgi:hypothetical protein